MEKFKVKAMDRTGLYQDVIETPDIKVIDRNGSSLTITFEDGKWHIISYSKSLGAMRVYPQTSNAIKIEVE